MGFPNRDTQFSSENQPSGRGRPVGTKNRSTVAKYWLSLEQKVENPITGEKDCVLSQEDIISLAMIVKARKGDVNAFKALMDCAYSTSANIDMATDNKPIDNSGTAIVMFEDYVKQLREEYDTANAANEALGQ